MPISKTAKLILTAFLVVFLVVLGFKYHLVYADEYDVLQSQIDKLGSEINLYSPAQSTNKSNLKALQDRVSNLKAQIDSLLIKLEKKQLDINKRNSEFDNEYAKLSLSVRSYYIRSYYPSGLIIILGSQSAADAIRMLGIYSLLSKRDRDSIVTIATSLAGLQKEKIQLQSQIDTISGFKKDIDAKAQFLAGEVAKVDAYIGQLQTKIAQLSARQQEILAQRLAGLHISRSASSMGRCDSDLTNGRDPGFSPKIAVFTYGVPNRIGLNQYGAWGRAKDHQSAEDILQVYYPGLTLKKDYDQGATINVDGYGPYNVEEYTKRIYEMPSSWTDNDSAALKAQAVAARSYGLAHRGGICTTESCQVFKQDPKNDNGGSWVAAVDATKGWVLVDGSGNPASTQYSSTHGGYILNIPKFDGSGSNPNNFSELNDRAYDKDSPWFYCDWGSRSQYNKTAWLTQEEMADIVNAILLGEKDSSTQEHLYQPDNPPSGTDTWSPDRVKQELRSRSITPFNSVSGAGVNVDWGSGRTTSVSISGDADSHTFDGAEFKNFFNLRTPANIQIVGPLYNIEKR